MRGSDRIAKHVERGILLLVFLLLILQTVLFVRTSFGRTLSEDRLLRETSHGVRKDTLFYFDPNYATVDELVALGLSPKQAEVVVRWREKGGYFWEKEDFARMYSVSDSMFQRLEPYLKIQVPLDRKLELNQADSASLDALPGIGPYYTRKILAYRDRLGGYRTTDQLLEAGLDSARWKKIRARLWCDTSRIHYLSLSETPADSLARHPYIGSYVTGSILRWRNFHTGDVLLEVLVEQRVVSKDQADRMRKYCRP